MPLDDSDLPNIPFGADPELFNARDEESKHWARVAEADRLRTLNSTAGAALPPAQGGPSFSQTEMQVLAGGQPPAERWSRPAEQAAQPATFDLDAVKKEVEDSLSKIDTTAALEDARKNLGKVLSPERENPPMIEVGEARRRSAAGDESWRLPPEERAKWERTMSERRRRTADAAKSAMSRSLSGGRATGPKITDDEAFGAEGALIVGSPDSVGASPLPF